MSSVNGVAGAAPRTRRAVSKPVVPVLPLNYPQRPATKQNSAQAVPLPRGRDQAGLSATDDKTGTHLSQRQEQLIGNAAGLGPSVENGIDHSVSSTASAKPAVKAEPSEPDVTLDERAKDTPKVSSAFPDRRIVSLAHRFPAVQNPAPDAMTTPGPVLEAPVPAPHPAIMNRPTFHQPHPSNGSLIFGAYHDSNASSPAPHSGGSGFPPPGMLPYPHVAPVDGYGRPLLVSQNLDGYPPNLINHHGPPTPHSFQGSQSSAQAEEHALNPYPTVNGHNGYPADPMGQVPVPPPGPPMNGTLHAVAGSVSAYQSFRDQDESLAFLRHGISDDTFNDCTLEVRFPESSEFQDHPDYRQLHRVLRTHGHRFVYSRSPTLAGVMKAQRTMPGGAIYLELHDEYMRPDVFWYSLRTLYGWSLADGILPTDMRLRDARDDLKTALCYIATARYLQLGGLHAVAVQHASRLLFWNTIELAVKFASRMVAVPPRNAAFNAPEFLGRIVLFIVHNFPVDFVLDVNASDSGFPRLPPASLPTRDPNAPTIAHGTSRGVHSRQSSNTQAQMPRNPRVSANPRLSQIKFGDISPSKNGCEPRESSEDARSPRVSTPNDAILSRILLNLPFELLKQILEHPHLGKSSGDFSPSSRQSLIADIIAEREYRRLKALEKADPRLRAYQERVESEPSPPSVENMDDYWVSNMGFKEEVFSGDLPYLVRTWTRGSPASLGA